MKTYTFPKEQLAKAFTQWHVAYRNTPSNFDSDGDPTEVGKRAADYIIKILEENSNF